MAGWADFQLLSDMAAEIVGCGYALAMFQASIEENFPRAGRPGEMKKYSQSRIWRQKHGAHMVKHLDTSKFTGWSRPGIRAQLIR